MNDGDVGDHGALPGSRSYHLNVGDYEMSNETDDGCNLAIENDLGSLVSPRGE